MMDRWKVEHKVNELEQSMKDSINQCDMKSAFSSLYAAWETYQVVIVEGELPRDIVIDFNDRLDYLFEKFQDGLATCKFEKK